MYTSQAHSLPAKPHRSQNLQVSRTKSFGIRDIYVCDTRPKSPRPVEMSAADKQRRVSRLLPMGFAIRRDQSLDVVAGDRIVDGSIDLNFAQRKRKSLVWRRSLKTQRW